jgi:hypothetical protein
MVPGCIADVEEAYSSSDGSDIEKPDELYPEIRYLTDRVPVDILDWMDHRKHLVDAWKSSYEEFHEEFARGESCLQQWI